MMFGVSLLVASMAHAAPIAVSGSFAMPSIGAGGTLTEEGLPNATDGNLATGYLVTATPGTINQSTGVIVRWDFDVSGFASISSFTFTFDGILNDPSTFDQLRIGASRAFGFVRIDAPDGVQVSTSLLLTPGATSLANDLNNYVSSGVLSVFVVTEFGTGPASNGATSLNTLEVSGDIVGVLHPDTDGDDVPDTEDSCPDSDLRATVVIDGCNSRAANDLFADGCTIADLVINCLEDSSTQIRALLCTTRLTKDLRREGALSAREAIQILGCTGRSLFP
jgi:hypothetical protein